MFFQIVGPHLISLSCVQLHADGKTVPLVFSGFLVEASGRWCFVTAGHTLEELSAALKKGAEFDRWRLDDQTAGDRFKGAAVPIDFNIEDWLYLHVPEAGIDYAALPLRDLYRAQLHVGGARPLGPADSADNPEGFEQFAMVGTPLETIQACSETVLLGKTILLPLEPSPVPLDVDRAPEGKLYFRLKDRAAVKDIAGMSGCPVFGLKKDKDKWQYKVLGVQSTWYKDLGVTAASPLRIFVEVLEEVFTKH